MLQDVCDRWNMPEVTAEEVYTDIFRLGEGYIQKAGETRNMKGNPLVYMKSHNRQKGEYRILLEDTIMDTLKEAQEADFSIVNGLTYFGRKNIQAAAHQMYAMIFDLDGVTEDTLMDFFSGAIRADTYPTPNYISLSGHGVHLYYLFEEPVSLYPNMKVLLKEIKYALIRLMWNPYTSTEERRQYQGINQSFRLIGGKTKIPGVRVRAFKVIDQKYTVKDLYDRVADAVGLDFDKKLIEREKKLTLEEAAEKYPEWYQRRIIEGDTSKGRWTDKRDLYDWWKRQIATGATHGHRYFCVMALCIYGVKCDISQEEVEADAYGLIPFMNEVHAADPFTEEDVESALECFDERYVRFPRKDIDRITGIHIPANRRNGRKQKVHLQRARAVQNIDYPFGEWRRGNGRKSKQHIVEDWQRQNPGKRKADCIRDTGLDRKTVTKYWNPEPVENREIIH